EGDAVGTAYDPLLAKLVAHGATRADALDRLAAALAETEVEGVTTNVPFLRWLVAHPAFRAARLSTAFLVEHPPLSPPPLRLPAGPWRGAWRLNLTAPMPGTVLRVDVAAGDAVAARQPLLVLEAMKMETPVLSPFDATVTAIHVAPGDRVAGGALLVELEA